MLVTNPSLARVGRVLLEGLRTPTVINDDSAAKDFDIVPLSSDRAIETALNEEDREFAETSWFDELNGITKKPYGGIRPDQTLYKKVFDKYVLIAMIWPWGDQQHMTLKMPLIYDEN